MPGQITLNDHPLLLSPEFEYRVMPGSDTVNYAYDHGVSGMGEDGSAEAGDVLPSNGPLLVSTLGTAEIAQYSHDEGCADPEVARKEAKARAKAARETKDEEPKRTASTPKDKAELADPEEPAQPDAPKDEPAEKREAKKSDEG